jgi:pectinesterase
VRKRANRPTGQLAHSPECSNRREFILGIGAVTTTALMSGCTSTSTRSQRFDAALSRDGSAVRGVPGYPTLTAALAAAPADSSRPLRILVPAGTWRECVLVSRPNVQLIGEHRDSSILICNERAGAQRAENAAGSTLEIRATDFHAAHLTIANDFDYPGNQPADVPYDRTGASGAQARALHLNTGSDRCSFDDCAITGWQDTLFTEFGRSVFSRCFVSGCVDFIYGAGIVIFDHCEILSRTRPGKDFHGFIAAPNTDRPQRFGLVFLDCRLVKDRGMAPHTVALGRPWRRTGTFPDGRYGNPDAVGNAVFLRCWMDDHIVEEGWYPMHYNNKEGVRVMLQPEEARMFEFDSRGPGKGTASARRRQLSRDEARDYTPSIIFDGWEHDAGH